MKLGSGGVGQHAALACGKSTPAEPEPTPASDNATKTTGASNAPKASDQGGGGAGAKNGGDPLDYRTFAEKTFVSGKLLYEKDKSPFFSYVKNRDQSPTSR